MPQKRNPDAAELIRAKVGRITGALVALLTVMKGLPLAYSKDMQEDKEQVFDAADALMLALAAMTGMVARHGAAAPSGCGRRPGRGSRPRPISPTGWCARLGLPFREAHHVTGALVQAGGGAGRRPAGAARSRRCRRCIRDHRGGLRSAWGGQLGGESGKLWRHGAGPGARAGPALAGGARRERRRWRRIGLCLALAALAACGIKGDPVAPEPEDRSATPLRRQRGRARRRGNGSERLDHASSHPARPASPWPRPWRSAPRRRRAAEGPVLLTVTGDDRRPEPRAGRSRRRQALPLQRGQLREGDGVRPRRRSRSCRRRRCAPTSPRAASATEFSGPLLDGRAGRRRAPTATLVTVQAMDGYAVEVPMQEMVDKGAVVALARDGKPLGIGSFGPTQIVFPRARAAPTWPTCRTTGGSGRSTTSRSSRPRGAGRRARLNVRAGRATDRRR